MLMTELELVEGLLQADLDKSWSSQLLTLLSSDPRNCCKPTAVKVSGNGRGEQVLMPIAYPETRTR